MMAMELTPRELLELLRSMIVKSDDFWLSSSTGAGRLRAIAAEMEGKAVELEEQSDIAAGLAALKEPVVGTWDDIADKLNLKDDK